MTADEHRSAPEETPRRRRRWLRVLAWLVALSGVLVAGGTALLGTQAALDYAVRRAVAAAQGHLTIEGAEGSLLSTVRIARLAWHGDEFDVEARETALTWMPLDLLSRRFIVQGLGAKHLSFEIRPGQGSPTGMPENLALPLEVDVRNIGVERIDWRTGDGSGSVTGVTFAYEGGARSHSVRALRVVSDFGTLSGEAQVAAAAPFPLKGALGFEGDGEYRGGHAQLSVAGTLERIAVDARGTLRNAGITAKAALAPFAPAPLVSADIDARDVDLAQFAPALPATALTLNLAARPSGAGFAGTLSARNANAGPLDAGRVPVAALASKFTWDGKALALSDIDAEFPGAGRATGSLTVPAGGGPVDLDLTIARVDLKRIQSSLMTTALSGSITAQVGQARQVVRADLRQEDLAVAFAATVAARRMTIERFRAQAGGGDLTGSGSFDFDGARAFTVTARAARFNPARFVAVPEGRLDGTVSAHGTLAPAWDVTADVKLAKGSRFAGMAVAGSARAHATPKSAKDVAVDLALGSSRVALTGAFGAATDTLAFDVEIAKLSELKPLLARYADTALPDPVGGKLHASGKVSGDPASPGVTITAKGEALQWGRQLRARTLDLAADVAPGSGAGDAMALTARAITLKLAATGLSLSENELSAAGATVTGTLAQHKATLTATGEGFELVSRFAGGIAQGKRPDGERDFAWKGTLEVLSNSGTYAMKLEGPAPIEIARGHIRIGAARIAVADGRADLASLAIDDGRVTTKGSFTAIPAAVLARIAGTPLPFPSTLELGGAWSLDAAPRLNGTLEVRRERGDWYVSDSATLNPSDLALGITVLELSANFSDDALTSSARFRSTRAGTADATVTLAAGTLPGRIATDAPLAATLTADLASLRPLQPWLGTLAVMDGRAHLAVTARGTLAQPSFGGTLAGDALRFDLPQYGVHLKDGRLRVRLADQTVLLDEFSFAGGAGRFSAKGTLAKAGSGQVSADTSTVRVEWQAQDFTVVNRPDLSLVADGSGTLAIENRKLSLTGKIKIDEGRVDYSRSSVGTLSEDVVIVGQPRRVDADAGTRDLPLVLDVEVALGRNFRFTGEGLDTRLAGSVRIATTPAGTLAANGTIRAVDGTYTVFGQRLTIDRGQLLFDGPADNPALDVVALRKNLAVEAGVELTGTVRVPRVRLVSNPPVPDGEKLSWLLTGQGLDRANSADLAALSAASASLLGQGKRPITQQIANSVGLDDISVRGTGSSSSSGTSGQVVAFGKRITNRLTLVYEQGLTLATNALRLEYALSRSVTLRAEAGTVSSFGVFYRRSYE